MSKGTQQKTGAFNLLKINIQTWLWVWICACVCACVHFTVPLGPPTNLVVYNETTTSLNARWNPSSGRVQNYRITYVPTSGGRSQTVSLTWDRRANEPWPVHNTQYHYALTHSRYGHSCFCYLKHAGSVVSLNEFVWLMPKNISRSNLHLKHVLVVEIPANMNRNCVSH